MEDIIGRLLELERTDRELIRARKRLAEIPAELTGKERALAEASAALERLREECARLQADLDATDLEIRGGEEILARYKKQLGMCKSTREMTAIRNQMKAQQVWIDQYVEKGMALMQELEKKKAEAARLENEIEAARVAIEEAKALASAESSELQRKEADLSESRERIAAGIPADDLAVYESALRSRGEAIARVCGGGTCSACYMRLPPQIHNLVLLKKGLVTCPSCGRILTP
ncbi:MAG: C4-type zinc ribbon domain-containing protein [Planctomycetota bacterium]|nr:C4-type zinc ribbon domain-containing protein [Planctomycetota bacterium]